jgi:hypothetical protein
VTRKGAVPLSEDLDRYLSALGIPQVTLLVSLHKSWPGIAGPILSAKATPARFRNGVLTIAVRNHAWAQELQLCKPGLLEKIVAATGPGSPVSDLRFVVGAVPAEEGTAAEPAEEPCAAAPDPEGLSSVPDAETRESLRAISRRLRPRGDPAG